MRFELFDSNVVIPANTFNPSVVSQHWLIENGIITEDESQSGQLFTEVVSRVQTPRFGLVIVPPRLQFNPLVPVEEQQSLIVEKVGSLVSLLPHTPFTAGGLNFTWHLFPDEVDGDIPTLSRQLFCREGDPFYAAFGHGNPRYGAYLSCDTLGMRLKLDIKPLHLVSLQQEDNGREFEVLQFSFNFHLELSDDENASRHIQDFLLLWNDAREKTVELLNIIRH